jgi:hypothetical protein
MHRRALLVGGGLLGGLLAAAWTGWPRAAEPQPADLAALEPLYAVSAAPGGVTIRVASRGCTAKADFAFYVDRRPGGAAALAFGRKRLDICKPGKAAGGFADLMFSYAELGVSADTPLFVLNPIAPRPRVITVAPRHQAKTKRRARR